MAPDSLLRSSAPEASGCTGETRLLTLSLLRLAECFHDAERENHQEIGKSCWERRRRACVSGHLRAQVGEWRKIQSVMDYIFLPHSVRGLWQCLARSAPASRLLSSVSASLSLLGFRVNPAFTRASIGIGLLVLVFCLASASARRPRPFPSASFEHPRGPRWAPASIPVSAPRLGHFPRWLLLCQPPDLCVGLGLRPPTPASSFAPASAPLSSRDGLYGYRTSWWRTGRRWVERV